MLIEQGETTNNDYEAFIKAKECIPANKGFVVTDDEINPILKPFQRACVRWALEGGCRALFEAFGLGKSMQQIELVRLVRIKTGCDFGAIVAPLGVRQEFQRDAYVLRTGDHPDITNAQRKQLKAWQKRNPDGVTPEIHFIQKTEQINGSGIYITNYESVREGKIDLTLFGVITLDEASCLRSFGSKTFSEFLFGPVQNVLNRFVATATPSPNEYQELLAYAHFLGIMDIGQARTRFFKRNSEKSDDLTLHRHKEKEFWLWVASWALFLQKPSDLGYSDEGYELPELEIVFHELPVDHTTATADKHGQGRLLRQAAAGVSEASREKRETLTARVARSAEIVAESPDDHFILWHDLEDERKAITSAVPGTVAVYGSQKLDVREKSIIGFSDGEIKYLAGKPQMLGSGCNFQRHCHRAIYVGIGFKFNDFIQSIHRLLRYLQTHKVRIDIIYAESEKSVLEILLEKWERDKEQRAIMTEIIKKYGLVPDTMRSELTRTAGVDREVVTGELFECVYNDAVVECRSREENSVGLILTSIPFANQYEYTPSYNDFGHTDDNEHFFAQMDFLTPELYRVLQPGRIAAIHVKDRVVDGRMSGLGFQTIYRFADKVCDHFEKHGFYFMGRVTVATDVVRENNQTYRLGYSEQLKDGTKHGVGMPEYVLYFRKPPSETSNSYADLPVTKSGENYSLGRWQIDAHGFIRSSGERLLTPTEIKSLPWATIYRLFKQFSLNTVYDYEKHVELCTALRDAGRLPIDFMLLPPQSWHSDVWTDVTRMKSLNSTQAQKGRALHLCPLQFDICDRVITQKSMPGEVVLDPFGGLSTVAVRAIRLGRRAITVELNHDYFLDGAAYCMAAEQKALSPSLFALDAIEAEVVEEEFAEVAA